ncbi:protein-tyrosine phosphatase-like protein [Cladorrhinum sp. PSN332]|nr:protein-tyrosine phosphatase-like protein [Cladorrhinum sp. PSN332]
MQLRDPPPPQQPTQAVSQITPNLYIGTLSSSTSIPLLLTNHITALVSLTHSPFEEWSRPANRKIIPAKNHLYVQCDDSPDQDILCRLEEICDFIDNHSAPATKSKVDAILAKLGDGTELKKGVSIEEEEIHGGGKVLVHCYEGVSRSGAIVVAYLMRKEKKSLKETLRFVRRKRRVVQPSRNFMQQLKVWERDGCKVWKEDGKPRDGYRKWLENKEK